jgi:phosphopantothenate-cysteine ligase
MSQETTSRERKSSTDDTDQFFADSKLIAPQDLCQIRDKAFEFCQQQVLKGRPIVLVTSGGTTVPLEHNTVRFVDNFSAGTRGSTSVE